MSESTYKVTGMTCSHCADAITEEVGALARVDRVAVDVEAGSMTVTSAGPVRIEDLRAALEEAGDYELVAS
ncbi:MULTISPECIES: heavy-metal-associated domain-containing protein [unclassified Streptomyces]|uniref:heavy-metal-associated domain-containing protein n=1 Tax=unclassified Streptomyces TaxID=2593676 RepID=UPI003D8B5367